MYKYLFFIILFIISKGINAQYYQGFYDFFKYYSGANTSELSIDSQTHKVYFCGEHRRYFTDSINDVIIEWDGDSLRPILTVKDLTAPDYIHGVIRYKNELYAYGLNQSVYKGKEVSILKFNGTQWDSLTEYPNDFISNMIVNNGRLYACGQFTKIGNTICNHVAYLDSLGWHPMDQGICEKPNTLYGIGSLTFYHDTLYMAGQFYDTCNPKMFGIGKYYNNSWHEVKDMENKHYVLSISAMAVYQDKLYVGGNFNRSDGWNIACFDGANWQTPGGGSQNAQNGPIISLTTANNKLYATGLFENIGGINTAAIASWNGHQWCSIDTQSIAYYSKIALKALNDTLYFTCQANGGFNFKDNHGYWTGKGNTVECGSYWTEINQLHDDLILSFSPNPASTEIVLHTNMLNYSVEIRDINGRNCFIPYSNDKLNIQTLSCGMYFIILTNNENRIIRKFIKE